MEIVSILGGLIVNCIEECVTELLDDISSITIGVNNHIIYDYINPDTVIKICEELIKRGWTK